MIKFDVRKGECWVIYPNKDAVRLEAGAHKARVLDAIQKRYSFVAYKVEYNDSWLTVHVYGTPDAVGEWLAEYVTEFPANPYGTNVKNVVVERGLLHLTVTRSRSSD